MIRLGVPSVLGIFLFKKIIPDFEKRFPQIQLKIYETATVDGIEMLENSALDLLVGIKNKTSYADCDSREIFKSELMLAVSKRNPLAKENLVTGEMLEDIPMVLISKGSYHYQEIVGTFGREKLNITMHSSQISTIKHVISASNAATIIYREVFEDDPDICCIPLEVSLPAYVHIFWKKNTYKSEAMDKVISYLSMPDI